MRERSELEKAPLFFVLSGYGHHALHPTAQLAALVGAALGIFFEVMNVRTKGAWMISGVGMGLGFVLRFSDAWLMAVGTLFFWLCQQNFKDKKSFGYRAFVDNQETTAAGVIAGGSIIGIVLILIESSM